MAETTKDTFENVNDLLKAVLWPVIVLVVFLTYKEELNKIFQMIPEKLENSSKISVGSLSFEIEKTARRAGNAELGGIIHNLSEDGIRQLLTLGSGRHSIVVRHDPDQFNNFQKNYSLPVNMKVLIELEESSLLKADEPLEAFNKFFMTLNPDEKMVYKSGSILSSEEKHIQNEQKITQFTISESKLSQAQLQRIERMGVELSESGVKAFRIIVGVISEQINNKQGHQ
jgi:hypothetical protein